MSKPTQKQLAGIYQCDPATITRLKKAGVDIYNLDEVRTAILNQPNRPRQWSSGCPLDDKPEDPVEFDGDAKSNIAKLEEQALASADYNQSRYIRTKIQSLKELLQLQVLAGDYVHKDEVFADYTMIGNALKASIVRMQSDLPGMLEGLTAPQMKVRLKERGHQLMGELAQLSEAS